MFSVCKQTHPATGIEHSISCHFFNNYEENIVTAGANSLKVFRITPDVEPNTTEKYSGKKWFLNWRRMELCANSAFFFRFATAKDAFGMCSDLWAIRQCDGHAISIVVEFPTWCHFNRFQRCQTVSRPTRPRHIWIENVVVALLRRRGHQRWLDRQLLRADNQGGSRQSLRSYGYLWEKVGCAAIPAGQFTGWNWNPRCEANEENAAAIDCEDAHSGLVHHRAERFGRKNWQCHWYWIPSRILWTNTANSIWAGAHISRPYRCSEWHLHNGGDFTEHSATRSSNHLDCHQFTIRLHSCAIDKETDWRLFGCCNQFVDVSESKCTAVWRQLE